MENVYYLSALVLPLFSFFFQSYPRFFNKYFGIDVWKRMIEADLVRRNGHRIPQGLIKDGFIIEGYFDYPPFFPWLLSFMSKETLLKSQGFIAPIFDSLQNIVVFFITFQITGRIDISLLSQLIYTFTPLTALENSYLTPRSLGYLNFTLAFFPLLLYSITPNPYYLLAAFIFITLLFFTHRFALQSLFFVIIFFSVIDKTYSYLLVFIASFLGAVIISNGYYLRILSGHILLIYFWIKNYKYRFAHQIRGFNEKKMKMDFVSIVYLILSKFTPVSLIGTNLWLLAPFIMLFGYFTSLSSLFIYEPILLYKLGLWAVFCYILSTVVLSIKFLVPIGEGQRYLEMALVPTSILAAIIFVALLGTSFKTWVIIIYSLIFISNIILIMYSQWKAVITDKTRSLTKDLPAVFSYLNNLKYQPRIICIPHAMNLLFLYNTKSKALVDIDGRGLMRLQEVFPILKNSIKNLAKKYSLNLLVLKKSYATADELKIPKKYLLIDSPNIQIYNIENL